MRLKKENINKCGQRKRTSIQTHTQTHTHTHTHTHRTHAHTHTHTRARAHAHTHTLIQTLIVNEYRRTQLVTIISVIMNTDAHSW